MQSEPLESRVLLSGIRYVDVNAPGPDHNGTSWSSAYTDLHQALAVASAGDQIRVADGLYRPSQIADRSASFFLKTGVSLLGGYAGSGAPDPDARDIANTPTILSGDLTPDVASLRIVTAATVDSSAVLDGFTLTSNRRGGWNGTGDGLGVGIHVENASPTISNCTFTLLEKAGVDSIFASPTIANCTFTRIGGGDAQGAAILSAYSRITVRASDFSDNTSFEGAAIHGDDSTLDAADCSFSRNNAYPGFGGGAIHGFAGSLSNCTFTGNTARWYGGAIDGFSGSITACAFFANGSNGFDEVSGGAVADFNGTMANCLFVGNSAGYWGVGGALYNFTGTLDNCTFVQNHGPQADALYGISGYADIYNCIFRGSSSQLRPDDIGSRGVRFFYDDLEGSADPGAKIIDADPLFVRNPTPGPDQAWGTADDDYGDLHLQIASPCIDTGGGVPNGLITDFDRNARIADVPGVGEPAPTVDMGAFEYPVPLAATAGDFLFDALRPSIRVAFNANLDPATLSSGDLILQNLTTGEVIDTAHSSLLRFDLQTCSVTWELLALLPDGNYRASLPAGGVSAPGGNTLGSGFSFDFFVLAGDANRDRKVDARDLGVLASHWQQPNMTFDRGDFNYDGNVDVIDLGILAANWQHSLAAPPARAAASPALRWTAAPRSRFPFPSTHLPISPPSGSPS